MNYKIYQKQQKKIIERMRKEFKENREYEPKKGDEN